MVMNNVTAWIYTVSILLAQTTVSYNYIGEFTEVTEQVKKIDRNCVAIIRKIPLFSAATMTFA
jgi:hypothetical protein